MVGYRNKAKLSINREKAINRRSDEGYRGKENRNTHADRQS